MILDSTEGLELTTLTPIKMILLSYVGLMLKAGIKRSTSVIAYALRRTRELKLKLDSLIRPRFFTM